MKTQLKATFAFFLGAFDLRWTHRASLTPEEVTTVEVKAISAFMEVVVKLDEATFRPLFVRVYDWAAVALADEATREWQASIMHFAARP
jgi:U3 small nucleolar RNA-associated protein 10